MSEKEEAKEKQPKIKKGSISRESEDRMHAATIATRHVINPDDEHLVEVSNIPVGAAHSLVMLQAYEEHIQTTIDQVRTVQEWYLIREFARKYGKDHVAEHMPFIKSEMEEIERLDTIDLSNSFIHRFRHAYFQVSRGKEAKLLEILEVLSDTDMQTRSPDMEDMFRSPRQQ